MKQYEIGVNQLANYLQNGYQLIDIRDELSFQYGNVIWRSDANNDANHLLETYDKT